MNGLNACLGQLYWNQWPTVFRFVITPRVFSYQYIVASVNNHESASKNFSYQKGDYKRVEKRVSLILKSTSSLRQIIIR